MRFGGGDKLILTSCEELHVTHVLEIKRTRRGDEWTLKPFSVKKKPHTIVLSASRTGKRQNDSPHTGLLSRASHSDQLDKNQRPPTNADLRASA